MLSFSFALDRDPSLDNHGGYSQKKGKIINFLFRLRVTRLAPNFTTEGAKCTTEGAKFIKSKMRQCGPFFRPQRPVHRQHQPAAAVDDPGTRAHRPLRGVQEGNPGKHALLLLSGERSSVTERIILFRFIEERPARCVCALVDDEKGRN